MSRREVVAKKSSHVLICISIAHHGESGKTKATNKINRTCIIM